MRFLVKFTDKDIIPQKDRFVNRFCVFFVMKMRKSIKIKFKNGGIRDFYGLLRRFEIS